MSKEMKKIKVAFILGALNRGGTESLILDICRRAERCPFDVVCIYRKEGSLSEEFHKTNASLINIPKVGGWLHYIWNLRRVFTQEKIDIIHSQTPSNTLVLSVAMLGLQIKLLTSFHGHSFAHANRLKRKIVYNQSKKIICVSESQKKYYQEHWHLANDNKIEVVYNGIDTSKFEQTELLRPKVLNNTPLSCNFVTVGSFCSGRSQDFLLRVICLLQEILREKNVKFYFVGGTFNGEEYLYQQCEQFIKNNQIDDIAIMLGVRNDVLAFLQHVDGFLYSTKTDTFGIAVVEAMMSGVPVMTNDYVVMKEVTHNGALAMLYKSNDIEDCSQRLLEFIDNIDEQKAKANTIKDIVKNIYSIDNHINKLMNIYCNL